MIRKCNTTSLKSSYTPIQNIYTSPFEQNQQEQEQQAPPNAELNFNILKIRQCNQQTSKFMTEMTQKLQKQSHHTDNLQELYQRQKAKTKTIRQQYHQILIESRKKEEKHQTLQQKYNNLLQNYEFVKCNSDQTILQLLLKEQQYKQQIHTLQNQIELMENMHMNYANHNCICPPQQQEYSTTKYQNESTFI